MKLHYHQVAGFYTDETNHTIAFMQDNGWAIVYKYVPDARICFGEHRLDEPILEVITDWDKQVDKEIKDMTELKRFDDKDVRILFNMQLPGEEKVECQCKNEE